MDLTIGQLIKIIIGVFVFVVVVGGLYFFFKNHVFSFFENTFGEEAPKFILSLLK